MTKTKTPIETLPYEEALRLADEALRPHLGNDIGKGWVFNGGTPYETAKGKLLYNLNIQPREHLNEVEEAQLFHDTGIEAVVAFLERIGIISIAHFVVGQEEADLVERLRAL